MNHYIVIAILAITIALDAYISYAADPNAEPALIKANALHHDQNTSVITASGSVEITQGKRVLLADEVTYNQNTDNVRAKGNISLLEPTGDVFFADEMELTNEMKQGVVNEIQARFNDDSLLAADKGKRLDEYRYTLENAAYSPCPVCTEDGKPQSPLWQLTAKKVKLDEEKQRVMYQHGFFEVYEVPVFYTPYFSHATPNADRKSGFLIPKYGNDSTLGTMVEIPYYINIAPEMDATLKPIFTSNEGTILSGEFRHMVVNGRYELMGSITQPGQVDDAGNPIPGKDTRGHIEGYGNFALENDWQWGFSGKRATDDTYLRRYQFGDEDDLTTRVYAEQLKEKNYTTIETLSFQGLQADDDPGRTPLILPYYQQHIEKKAGYNGSRWVLDTNSLILSRDEGAESRRFSAKGGWVLPHTTSGGHVFTFKANMRGDVYSVSDVIDPVDPTGETLNGTTGRAIPQTQLDWSFPLVKTTENARVFLEPVANFIVSPYGGNPDKIPNEDSQDLELSDDNLFADNRFTGLDRIENGPRANYGLRSSIQGMEGTRLGMLFGQNYRVKEDSNFTNRSGMDENFSDYVGRLTFSTTELFDIAYRFRIDREEFIANRNEVSADVHLHPVSLNVNYLGLDQDFTGIDSKREEISATTALALTDQWTFSTSGRRDLTADGGLIYSGANLLYSGACVDFTLSMYREFTRDRDIEPSTSFTFQISLKNLS